MNSPRLFAALLLTALLAGCGTAAPSTALPRPLPVDQQRVGTASGSAPSPRPSSGEEHRAGSARWPGPTPGDEYAVAAGSARPVPDEEYAVAARTFTVDPGSARPLPVTVWYPAVGRSVAPGRFPVVLYSHGLRSLPALHAALTTRWAAAGFVVAAPTYPNTNLRSARFDRADVRHQPADAWRVVRHLIRLDRTPGDPLAGHLHTGRIAAAGHSAGGFTTAGMFASGHPARLRAGIVIAGGGMAGSFAGPPAALLFVHGEADPIVPWYVGRAAYDRTDWPRAFLTLPGQGHGEYLTPGRPGFAQVVAATTDLLRWRLHDDPAALRRLPTLTPHHHLPHP